MSDRNRQSRRLVNVDDVDRCAAGGNFIAAAALIAGIVVVVEAPINLNIRRWSIIAVAVRDRLHHVVDRRVVSRRVERQQQRSAAVGCDCSDRDAVEDQISAFGQNAQQTRLAENVIAVGDTVARQRQRRVLKRIFTAINVGVKNLNIGI